MKYQFFTYLNRFETSLFNIFYIQTPQKYRFMQEKILLKPALFHPSVPFTTYLRTPPYRQGANGPYVPFAPCPAICIPTEFRLRPVARCGYAAPSRSNSFAIRSHFSSIGSAASIQCIVTPRRSIPRNHVICRFENWRIAVSSPSTISSYPIRPVTYSVRYLYSRP